MSSAWELCHQILSLAFGLAGGGLITSVIQNAAIGLTPHRFYTWLMPPTPPTSSSSPRPPPDPPPDHLTVNLTHEDPPPDHLTVNLTHEDLQQIHRLVQEANQPLVNELHLLAAEIRATRQSLGQGITLRFR